MFENHERHNVAVWGEIFIDRQPVSQFNDVLTLRIVDRFDDVPTADDEIAQVRLRAVCAGDIPSAPAIRERCRMVHGVAAG